MIVKDEDGHLDAGSHDDHTFRARQGLVYSVEEVPGDGLQRTDLAIEAPHSHHVLADRIDVTKEGAGVHRIVRSFVQLQLSSYLIGCASTLSQS